MAQSRAAVTTLQQRSRFGLLARPVVWVILLTSAGLALRLHRLGEPVLRWDEGWSLAHASLPWAELLQVAAAEWHPPLYVALLRLWLVMGKSATAIRGLSVLMGVAAVPLAYLVGLEWSKRHRVAVLAAGYAAAWPLLVYYGQVARMYALAALAVLAAAWCLLRSLESRRWTWNLGLVLCSATALYTLYPTAWAMAGLWLYGALQRPRGLPRLLLLGLVALALYAPWLLLSRGTLVSRLGGEPLLSLQALRETWALLQPTLTGLAFPYGARPYAAPLLGGLVLVGLLASPRPTADVKALLLPVLVLALSTLGVAYGARSYWFAPRHLVPCCAFVGLLLAWALDRLAARAWPLLPMALLALSLAYWPTASHYVYEKNLEVTGAFDPTEDHRYLSTHARPDDLVFFNVLARAGWYENLRRPGDARWSYALSWDPIIEPIMTIEHRLARAQAQGRQRFWFALYKGDYGSNAPLVAWLHNNLYPAGGEWQGEMLYLAFAAPQGEWQRRSGAEFASGMRLISARWTGAVEPGGAAAVELTWTTAQPAAASYKVFVHLVDASGNLVTQHDGVPASGTRPTDTWHSGEEIRDRHGLFLPPQIGTAASLRLLVGLYHADSGARLPLADGRDSLDLGPIIVR
ncbi:MAG: glycosyltransferase family 39 protein [Anaerolineae bacterium]